MPDTPHNPHPPHDDPRDDPHEPDPTDPSCVLAIVVGAHLRAESTDRPLAVALHTAIASRLPSIRDRVAQQNETRVRALVPVVITDLWYLNQDVLRAQPTISIGHPEVNALGAYLADKLPSVFTVDDQILVQMDPELLDPVVSCWGQTPRDTAQAIAAFLDHHADRFLMAACQPQPSHK